MNIAEYFIKNKVISWLFVALLLIGGVLSFIQLGQLEFPEFQLPNAMVNTAYPGASPEQVEEEVTLPLERAIQELEYVKHIDSISGAGNSQILVELKETYTAAEQPQIWDELRRKVNDAQFALQPGVIASVVNDDFSDVYGLLYNIRGEDYSLIQNQNVVSNAGRMMIDGQSVRIHPTGEFQDVSELDRLVISNPGSTQLVYLGDIADIYRTFDETPMNLYRSNGEKAISLGISFTRGVNVVDVGRTIKQRIIELESSRPVGIELDEVYNQSDVVEVSIQGFVMSLVQAVSIVIVVLLFAMGLRSGLLMGGILLLTILGTFIGMNIFNIELQLISLGAMIIAMGMLVDNAIVITEGVLVSLQRGLSKMEATRLVVQQNIWPLLGATVIAILAFAPIGLSPDSTGDFMGSLFQVLLISLLVSWVLAITLTPFFCHLFFKEPKDALVGSESDPYKGFFFAFYKKFLQKALKHRMISMSAVILALVMAVVGFGHVKEQFFPPSNTPLFFIDVWTQEGSDIRGTEEYMMALEEDIMTFDGVENVTSVIGMGAQRFILTYAPEKLYSSYGQLIVEAKDLDTIREILPEIRDQLNHDYPELELKFKLLEMGPAPQSRIEARFYGTDLQILRSLGDQALDILSDEPTAIESSHSWREQVNIVRPQLNENAARRSGISKQALDETLLLNFSGMNVGVYRDGSHLLLIIARAPENERLNADQIMNLQVWSQERNAYVPVGQVVDDFESETENPLIVRRDLRRVLTVLTDVAPFSTDTPELVRQRIKGGIEAIELPEGYTLEWGGEFEMAGEAQANLVSSLPMGYLIMFLITIMLFNTIRQPLAIWITVPLGVIGVAAGLLLLDMPFSFTALLGLLSLSGMLVKNGIVLVEQINIEAAKNVSVQTAIVDACVSRVRPVCMAALTTMLGMIPLVVDPFFSSMAITIIFGLGFATVLTLVVLPVAYSLFHRIRFDGK